MPSDIELVDIERQRFFAITETPTLFEEHALAIAWGPVGGPLRRRVETFASRAKLERRRRELLARRRRHGYVSSLSLDSAS
jgi:predicted DNA-binding WGR domain protein